MKLILNGEPKVIDDVVTLADALEHFELPSATFAIALNQTFVPREQYASIHLSEGDHIEIVTAMVGG